MTFTKLTLAALVLGASFSPALAESDDSAQSPLSVYNQSAGQPAHTAVIEGRQTAPIATPTHANGAEAYLDDRIQDQDR